MNVADPILDYAFGAFALIQFLTFAKLGVRGLKALDDLRDDLRVSMAGQTAAVESVEKSVEELREDQRSSPCRMTIEELSNLVNRLRPGDPGTRLTGG